MSAQMTRRAEGESLPALRLGLEEAPLSVEGLAALERLTSFAAHEIRNPLAALRATIQLAMATKDLERREVLLNKVIHSIDDLSDFLTELLALAGSKQSMLVPLDVRAVVADVMRLFSVQADVLHVLMTLRAPRSLPRIWGNAPLLRHAVMNLIKNSMEAMPEGGRLSVVINQRSGRSTVCVTVKDTGSGIPKAKRHRLFDGTNRTSGHGVGLPFVHRVITDVHRGRLSFKTKEGAGTSFFIELRPVTAACPPFAQPVS